MRSPTTRPTGVEAAPQPAYTLVELLVVITIIGLLVAVAFPALRRAREQGRVAVCLSNLKNQGAVLQQYAIDYQDALPPYAVFSYGSAAAQVRLINRTLAEYQNQPFERGVEPTYDIPTGIWRCPGVPVGRDDAERWTHSGYIHHAPNLWLFNTVRIFLPTGWVGISSDVLSGWEGRYGTSDWRRLGRVRRPSEIIALMDNVNFRSPGHGGAGREARQFFGGGWEVVHAPDARTFGADNRGSHDALARRPTLLVDGHGEALPSTRDYWMDIQGRYRPPGKGGEEIILHHREVRRFMWFISPEDYVGQEP